MGSLILVLICVYFHEGVLEGEGEEGEEGWTTFSFGNICHVCGVNRTEIKGVC